eukprot:m51a1_g6355 hypothetical protein (334) ;mRNA; f:90096-92100
MTRVARVIALLSVVARVIVASANVSSAVSSSARGPSYFRLVRDDGKLYPMQYETCPYLAVPVIAAPESVMLGVCCQFYGHNTCCPNALKFWTYVSDYLNNIVADSCCKRNLEHLFCAFACSPAVKESTQMIKSPDNYLLFLSYVTEKTALEIYDSCANVCSVQKLANMSSPTTLMNSVDISAFYKGILTLRLTIGYHPTTRTAFEMDVLPTCGSGRTVNDCSCYVPGSAAPNGSYCGQAYSERFMCCAHDRGFVWDYCDAFATASDEERGINFNKQEFMFGKESTALEPSHKFRLETSCTEHVLDPGESISLEFKLTLNLTTTVCGAFDLVQL